jgi:hypothetical protein
MRSLLHAMLSHAVLPGRVQPIVVLPDLVLPNLQLSLQGALPSLLRVGPAFPWLRLRLENLT